MTLRRRRLCALLRRAARARIVLCVAPAGYGKTTAVRHALGRCSGPLATLSLTDGSRGLFRFVRELAAALSVVLDGLELNFSAVYDRVASSDTAEIDLARWLRSQLPERTLHVVLDNVEYVAADAAVVRFLDRMVRDAPQIRWYLLSRSVGALPVPNWMADGLMDLPIDQHALAFDHDETAALASRYGHSSPPVRIGDVASRMLGWPLGIDVQLRFSGEIAGITYDRRNSARCYRLLLDACFALCSERERDLLLDTALMRAPHASAVRVLGWANARRTLRALRSRFPHFFELGVEAPVYHDLFRSYLIDLLHDRGGEAFAAAIRRCGSALKDTGRAAEALALYVECNAYDEIVALLEHHGFALVDSNAADLVNAALNALPSEYGASRPVTLALRASYESRLGRYDVSEAWYLHALKQAEGAVYDEISYRYACDLLRRQRPDCIGILESLAERAAGARNVADVRSALSQAYFLEERIEDARREMDRAVAALEEIDDAEVLARTLGRSAYVCLYSDDLPAAADFARRAVDLALPAGAHVIAIGALSVLYSVSCERGDAEDALSCLRKLGDLGARTGNLDFQLYALAGMYELYTESHDRAGIARCETALRSFDVHYDTSTTLDALLPARALQSAWRGEFERAYVLLGASATQQRGAEWKALRHAELALYSAACERREEARENMQCAREALEQAAAGTQMSTQALIFGALALSLLGERHDAERLLRAAADGVARFTRLRTMLHAAELLHGRWHGDRNHAELLQALQGLYAARYGGVARMLEQLPMPVAVRSLLRKTRASSARASARLLTLLERYPEVSLSG